MQRFVPALSGIRFSNYVFSEPVPLARWWPPRGAGVYTVLVVDPTWGPRPFQPVYFGSFGEHGGGPVTQEEYFGWFRAAAGRGLYVSSWSSHSPADAAWVRSELVRAYSPLCNRERGAENLPEAVVRRIDTLDKRDQEHDALLRVLLSAIGKLLEPQPEPRKRDFGFLARQTQPAA